VYEWDETKRRLNIESHGIDFIDAKEIWQGPVLEMSSPQLHHGEDRIVAIGLLIDCCITVIYTWRNDNRRLISARKARKNEQKDYKNATR